jgi:hypothetical protein
VPRELEPPPSEPKKGRKLVAHEIFSSFPPETPPKKRGSSPRSTGRVSFSEYEKMLADRPTKFSQEQVNYRKAEDVGKACQYCIHFYQQVAGEKRTVCEILRLEPEGPIDPEWVCDFTSRDGKEYPYQEKVSSQPNGEERETT